jgi:creatinine amidohydrolase
MAWKRWAELPRIGKEGVAMRKHQLQRMSWREAEAAFREKPVILIPMGSQEQHGPQCPMGDYRITEAAANAIAEASGALVTPALPFGYSEAFRNFPGTITLRPETLAALVEDVCVSLLRHGLDHLVIVNGHGGNAPTLAHMVRKIRAEWGVLVPIFTPFRMITPALQKELFPGHSEPLGHGGDPMGSLNLHLWPEDVNMADVAAPRRTFRESEFTGSGTMIFKDTTVDMFLDMDDLSPDGVASDATASRAEIGRRMMERITAYGIDFVKQFAQMDVRVPRNRFAADPDAESGPPGAV